MRDIDPSVRQEHQASTSTAAEQRPTPESWTAQPYRGSKSSIHKLFEMQVEQTPDAVALVFEDEHLTYDQLNLRANQLAHYLQTLHIDTEMLIGVCLERSLDLMIGILAILKAGGAYVPLDPSYPKERLAFMLADTRAPILLAHERLRNQLPDSQARVLYLDKIWQDVQQLSPSTPSYTAVPQNLAYIMYTSGSTGRPKGVAATHGGVVRLVKEANYAHFGPQEVMLQFAPVTFDASTFEIWGSLLNGGRLVLFPPYQPSLEELANTLCYEQVTTLWLTAGLFHQMVEHEREALLSIRQLLAGGDVLSVPHVHSLLRELPADHYLINGYGPTENTTFTCCYTMQSISQVSENVPIGSPIAHSEVYLLDDASQSVPIGAVGELYIGGLGLARGYLNRPDLTAERFVPHPYSQEPGARIYRTGDLARSRADGTIEFLGRVDSQVKIRGFRVEPGEIEAVLADAPGVRQCAVVVHTNERAEKSLVAYLVPKEQHDEIEQLARQYVQAKLPEYMVPSAWIQLEQLPLNPNGKVDRHALSAPDWNALLHQESYVPPGTPFEEIIAGIWASVFNLDRISVHDDLFKLGGHSLVATQIVSRIREIFHVDLPLRTLFEASTVARLATKVEEASKRGLGVQELPIVPISRDRHLPLTFPQERIWFLQQLYPSNTAYHTQALFRFVGTLNIQALERSLNELLRRHEILRTTFEAVDGQPAQVVHDSWNVILHVIRLIGIPPSDREKEALHRIKEESTQPFDISQLPLIRWQLLQFDEQDHILMHIEHHLIHDGWSFNLLASEMVELYKAFVNGQPSPLVEPAIQFADFAYWQRQWMQGPVLEKQLSYWQSRLSNPPDTLELPFDHARPATQSFRGTALRLELPLPLCDALRETSRKEGVSLFMLMLTAFFILLYRYTMQEDICIGTGIANRHWKETEGLIGMLVNTIALRADLCGNPTLRQLLQQMRTIMLEAYEHQDLPFDKLIESLQLRRDLSLNPLFQAMFAFHDSPLSSRLEIPGGQLHLTEAINNDSAKFDLHVIMIPRSEQRVTLHTDSIDEQNRGITAIWEYSTDLFDRATIEHMSGYYQTLLESITINADQRLWDLPLIKEAEQRRILVEWNATRDDYPKGMRIHELLEAQVQHSPDAVAIVSEDVQLSYGELHRRANQLAHYLQGIGVGPEIRVGLCIEPSAHLIVGLLGILKTGGAYVPLDPTYPKDRLEVITADAQIQALLTVELLRLSLPTFEAPIPIICLDSDWPAIQQQPAMSPINKAQPENLLYIIYTSGSTGKPKGVAAEQRQLLHYLHGILERMEIKPGSHMATVSTIVSDLGKTIVYTSLCTGSRLRIITQEQATDPDMLREIFLNESLDYFKTVPSHLVALMGLPQPGQLLPNRLVMLGGEALLWEWVEKVKTLSPDCIVLNHYGPTETTIGAVTYRIEKPACNHGMPIVPLGKPIANAQIYLLDPYLKPVPVGIPGEVYVGGDGLTRGYLNQPDLTAERFIPHPFYDEPGARLYRTGDLARAHDDGTLEFLRRVDYQVKLRGFRVELEEIESVLGQHAAVRSNVVIIREDFPGEKYLVAYVVPSQQEGGSALSRELRNYLQAKLPGYMVPAAIVLLDALPLTLNGKVNRRALPAPELTGRELGEGFVPPRNSIEELIVDVWSEVLKQEQVSIYDNFFDIGGHSLLATQIISRLRSVLHMEVPLRVLFEAPSIAELAERIGTIQQSRYGIERPLITPSGQKNRVALSFAQQRLWFLDQLEPGSIAYNVHVASEIKGHLDIAVLERCLNEMVRRHEVLRTTFPVIESEPVQFIAPSATVGLRIVDCGEQAESKRDAEITDLVAEEVRQPFNLAQGPLLRALLLRVNAREHLLVLTMHHIVSDGWSMEVFVREVAELYRSFSTGSSSPLPELTIQYRDYAIWQRQWLQGETLEKQIHYWKQRLENIPPLELPMARPYTAVPTHRGAAYTLELPGSLLKSLSTLSVRNGCTLYMTLLAAFFTLLYRYSGQEDIAIGTPTAGRNQHETEDLIGFFVNTLVLRTALSGHQSFLDLLEQVRETCLGAYAHEDLPFEKLVEELHPVRTLNRNPLFQVMFALLQAPLPALELPDVQFSSPARYVSTGTAKFDLTLIMRRRYGRLLATFEYNTDLFDEDSIVHMTEHLRILLEGIVAEPGRHLLDFPLITEEQAQRYIELWNGGTRKDVPLIKAPALIQSIHGLFELQAQRTPDAIALVFDEAQLTYGELNQRADRIATHLQKQGVGPEQWVGLCAERSLAMIIGVLGILKAGGVFVPFEPSLPRERLTFMAEDIRPCVFLVQRQCRGKLPENADKIILLDTEQEDGEWEKVTAGPTPSIHTNNAAYTIYTSGSTGTPKGVVVSHGSLLSIYLAWKDIYRLENPPLTHLQLASFSFDVFMGDLSRALCSGGKLVLCSQEVRLFPEKLYALIQQQQVQCAEFVPALLRNLTQYLEHVGRKLDSMEMLVVGSDNWTEKDYERFKQICGSTTQLMNSYGLTETAVDNLYYDFTGRALPPGLPVPLGRPFPPVRVYLLDELMQPVPVNVSGELYIGGPGVARGYLHLPDRTAERFLPDPFSNVPGSRLYRTGDRSRFRDGSIEFLGRLDHQIKLRGLRIEPGEIEAALKQHPTIQDAVVLLRKDRSDEHRMVAYIVPLVAARPDSNDLQQFLRELLPAEVVPTAFVWIEALPLTPSGKVDRRALAQLYEEPDNEAISRQDIAPDSIEGKLIEIWAQILKVRPTSVETDFFRLGGHSLLAAQLVWQIREIFNVDIPLRSIFEEPTIRKLAAVIKEYQDQEKGERDAAIRPLVWRDPTHLREYIDQLSEQEVDLLLNDLLEGGISF